MRTNAIVIHENGSPDIMHWKEVDVPAVKANQVLVRVVAAGLNYIDIYHRTGLYPVPLPTILGLEGAGIVEEVGSDVDTIKVGDKVGYCVAGLGAYANYRVINANQLIPLPKNISPEIAAAILLKGMTTEYLIRRTYPVTKDSVVLFHAAAGGVGLIACQWLHNLGATIIGTVGNEQKAELAQENGCTHTILYDQEDLPARVAKLTDGKGVDVVYDSVGKSTFMSSIKSLKPRGYFVSFGNASGPVPAFAPSLLAEHGGLFFTRPSLMNYCATQVEMIASANALFFSMNQGLKAHIKHHFDLKDAAAAHRQLENRQTTGSTILLT